MLKYAGMLNAGRAALRVARPHAIMVDSGDSSGAY